MSNSIRLSKYACSNESALRLDPEEYNEDPYFCDTDRILCSLSYIRYIDKTQVFSFQSNDHVQKRMLHVQLVSKIARTIGRALNLNEDLIEAASLGHDLGHVPFGHVGEKYLSKISLRAGVGYFHHNIHSVRILMSIENHGKGLNLNYQVLDAIMCHNGEVEQSVYYPKAKNQKEFLHQFFDSYVQDNSEELIPGTLEGCVVKISDIIAYLGRDLEDAIRLKRLTIADVPNSIKSVLGCQNRDIVQTIVSDIINHSKNHNYIKISDRIFEAIKELKSFNYTNIYNKIYSKEEFIKIEKMFNTLYEKYLYDINSKNNNSCIFTSYLNNMDKEYLNTPKEQIVIDYIAGMTDDYFINQYKDINKEKK